MIPAPSFPDVRICCLPCPSSLRTLHGRAPGSPANGALKSPSLLISRSAPVFICVNLSRLPAIAVAKEGARPRDLWFQRLVRPELCPPAVFCALCVKSFSFFPFAFRTPHRRSFSHFGNYLPIDKLARICYLRSFSYGDADPTIGHGFPFTASSCLSTSH